MSDGFSSEAWHRATPWFEAILRHPFVIELGDGSLPRDVFHRYLIDDAHYLTLYASALVTVAGRWPEPEGAATLARFGAESVEAERVLHRTLLETDVHRAEPTPTCLAYVNTLRSWAAFATTGVAMAGLLPCFRIYAEVGARLAASMSAEQGHPYREWASVYGDPAFAANTDQAEQLADAAADCATVAERDAMHDAYAHASRFEWMFWDAAYQGEQWPGRPHLERSEPGPMAGMNGGLSESQEMSR